MNTLRAADESLRLKAARKPVGLPEATVCATTIGSVSDSSCPSATMLERGPPIITPVADGSGSPFSSKIAAYRRVLPRRSGRRARLPCMICLGAQVRAVSSARVVVEGNRPHPPPPLPYRRTHRLQDFFVLVRQIIYRHRLRVRIVATHDLGDFVFPVQLRVRRVSDLSGVHVFRGVRGMSWRLESLGTGWEGGIK